MPNIFGIENGICHNWKLYLSNLPNIFEQSGICGAARNTNPRVGAAQNQNIHPTIEPINNFVLET